MIVNALDKDNGMVCDECNSDSDAEYEIEFTYVDPVLLCGNCFCELKKKVIGETNAASPGS